MTALERELLEFAKVLFAAIHTGQVTLTSNKDVLRLKQTIDKAENSKMTTKHTPGPWKINLNDSSNPIIGGDNQVVARVAYLAAWRHPLEAEANARLIAAAPELLDAIKRVVSACEENKGNEFLMGDGWCRAHEKIGAYLRPLIAKAEGRE